MPSSAFYSRRPIPTRDGDRLAAEAVRGGAVSVRSSPLVSRAFPQRGSILYHEYIADESRREEETAQRETDELERLRRESDGEGRGRRSLRRRKDRRKK